RVVPAPRRARRRRPPLPDVPRAARLAHAPRRHRARPRRAAAPRVVPRLIAVSEFTKRELVALLGVPPAKVTVVPNAVEDVFTPEGDRATGDYVLAVGTLEPRKNLERIAAAVDGELRVVGATGWGGVRAPANVTRLGEVDDAELARLYRGAR